MVEPILCGAGELKNANEYSSAVFIESKEVESLPSLVSGNFQEGFDDRPIYHRTKKEAD